MPPIMANSIDGQDHKEKYFDTSKKILSQEMAMCNMETLIPYFLEVIINVNFFFKWSNVKVKMLSTTQRSYHKQYSCEISKL